LIFFIFPIDFDATSSCILGAKGGLKMNLITISDMTKNLGISTRTLRYYEQIGLIESIKKDDYAYRTYDEATVTRL